MKKFLLIFSLIFILMGCSTSELEKVPNNVDNSEIEKDIKMDVKEIN